MISQRCRAGLVVDREDQIGLAQRQGDAIRAGEAVDQLERVALQKIEHGDLALVLDLAVPAHDARGIEADVGRSARRPRPLMPGRRRQGAS